MAEFRLPLGWVDAGLLTVLLLSVAIGLWRGLVFELMSLVGWLVAYVVAQAYAATLAPYIPIGAPASALQHGAGFAAAFLLALMGWTLLARLVRLMVRATPLTLLDRLLGAGFGVLRGAVVLLVAATLIALTPAAKAQAWQDSRGAAWLALALAGLKPVLPEALARHLPG
jgi:membrane protein required for colicin V production